MERRFLSDSMQRRRHCRSVASSSIACCVAAVVLIRGSLGPSASQSFLGSLFQGEPGEREKGVGRAASRRSILAVPLLGASLGLSLAGAGPAHAKLKDKDVERITKGYKNIVYLLDNFDEETTICNPSCKRAPDAVRSYLGLRSTKDPLFQLDKMLLTEIDSVIPGMMDEYQDALEQWTSSVSGGNADAFISSFGEYNPGGGKEQVEKYILRARENVEKAKGVLEILAKALDIQL
ncbi:unnamed protein product [Polarella glacialis]|uniref:Uncharacterized protein n=2 Tax=Polarella glacialis TaxID=89957 RepID=A0A813DH75_POLGL|nr:unnamed protein product [Polarella glacialis]CAE8640458.1 unnamed protein product [Polarella glacialis]